MKFAISLSQNYVSSGDNKTPNITTISGCNIGRGFCKHLVIKLICRNTGFAFRAAGRSIMPLDEIAGIISLYHDISGGR